MAINYALKNCPLNNYINIPTERSIYLVYVFKHKRKWNITVMKLLTKTDLLGSSIVSNALLWSVFIVVGEPPFLGRHGGSEKSVHFYPYSSLLLIYSFTASVLPIIRVFNLFKLQTTSLEIRSLEQFANRIVWYDWSMSD